VKFWFSDKTKRTWCAEASTGIRGGRTKYRGGYGSGEVLRPSKPRYGTGTISATRGRQTAITNCSTFSGSRNDGEWYRDRTKGRNAARRATLPTFSELDAG